ncbi:hypothetical protein [Acidipropionibacterium acidipropionici]|uniref:hypothetical protein n=1 Tax=Acidipropionibacterium acidipropionici TaxID=1748 RepID=UPI000689179E|nr:hypothetical protein [Acidipropionibacterium acidipropionici]ALN14710.1 hypothetical protein ASQ49_04810 [Acidipropionibacterium acidipropionici]APZ09536.1 hypothetical protein BWX38_10115 [Acidipropionibacterium acidipropionici]
MNDVFYRFDPSHEHLTKDGQPVTDDIIDEMAHRAERSGPPKGLVPGGKSLSGGRTHSPKVQVVLSRETEQKVRERADAEHMSVSRWIRRVLEKETS